MSDYVDDMLSRYGYPPDDTYLSTPSQVLHKTRKQAKHKTDNMKVTLKNVRASYLAIFTPKKNDKDPTKPAKYEATAILDVVTNAKDIELMRAAIKAVRLDPKVAGKKSLKFCLRKGDDTEARAEDPALGAGKMTVSARSTRRPQVVDRDLTPLAIDDMKPYSGCYVNMVVDVYAYANDGGGISASLEVIQFVKDGEALGGGAPVKAADYLESLEDEDGDII